MRSSSSVFVIDLSLRNYRKASFIATCSVSSRLIAFLTAKMFFYRLKNGFMFISRSVWRINSSYYFFSSSV